MRSIQNSLRVLLCVAIATGGVGCISIGSVQTASTVGKGKYEIGIEPGAQVLAAESGGQSVVIPFPHIDGSFRYGITDNIDIGARTGFSLLELQSKFMFTSRDNESLALSLAPTVAAVFFGFTYLNIQVPFLVGIKVGEDNELVIGPRIQNVLVFSNATISGSSSSAVAYVMGAGGSLGFAFRVSDSVKLLPELAVSVPVLGAASVSSGGSSSGGVSGAIGFTALQFQFKFGILIGNSSKRRSGSANISDMPPPPPPPPGAEGDMPPPPPPPPPAP